MESRQPRPWDYSQLTRWLLIIALSAHGCAYPTDEAGFVGPQGVPQVTATAPEDGASELRSINELVLTWDRHLDPFAGPLEGALRLSSEAEEIPLDLHYDLIRRSLVARPLSALSIEVTYELEILDPASLVDFAGRMPDREVLIRFSLAEWTPVNQPPQPLDALASAASEAMESLGCTGCHFEGYLPPDLTRLEQLVETRSREASARMLVVPGAPERSYLVHKLVHDYPDRVGSTMPPWATPEEIASNEPQLRAISDWIAGLSAPSP